MLRTTDRQNEAYTKQCLAIACAAVAVMAAMLIGGCNTMEGAGRDVEAAGEAVQDAAD